MSLKRKTILSIFVFGMAVVLSGCGRNPAPKQEGNQSASKTPSQIEKTEEKLPAATGKTEDIVSSALEGANEENVQAGKEEDAAYSVIEDSEETDDFSQSYDENEF